MPMPLHLRRDLFLLWRQKTERCEGLGPARRATPEANIHSATRYLNVLFMMVQIAIPQFHTCQPTLGNSDDFYEAVVVEVSCAVKNIGHLFLRRTATSDRCSEREVDHFSIFAILLQVQRSVIWFLSVELQTPSMLMSHG